MRALRLYVKDGCPTCPAALALFDRIADQFDLDARVVNLDLSWEDKPNEVFAVPTFTLDGRVVSLGTPSWDEMIDLLSRPDDGDDA